MVEEMERIKSYKDLQVWRDSMDFVVDIYMLTQNFPHSELYGLTSQLRRSSVSVPSNIAEGSGRKYTKEYVHFLYISKGSLLEVETQLEISNRLGYTKNVDYFNERIKQIRVMLISLIRSLEKKYD